MVSRRRPSDIYCRGVSAALAPYSVSCEGQTRLPQETGFERITRRESPAFTVRALAKDSGLGNPTAPLHSAIGHIPPTECEATYYVLAQPHRGGRSRNLKPPSNQGRFIPTARRNLHTPTKLN